VLIAMAPDVDARFERLYGYLQDDVSRRRASIGLWLELCGQEPAAGQAWRRLAGNGALTEGRLVLVEEQERPFLTRSLRVPDRVAGFLLGNDGVDPVLAALLHVCEPFEGPSMAGLATCLAGDATLAYIRERPGTAAAPLAAAALQQAGRGWVAVDLRRLKTDRSIITDLPDKIETVDRCPLTGRARLSYRRAAELFSAASPNSTLHQLRHSALTHAAEDGTNTPILLARSRHASVRSLERYARPLAQRPLPATSPSTTPARRRR